MPRDADSVARRGALASEPYEPDTPEAPARGIYIAQAARMVGVSPNLIRMWEREGLVSPARTKSGYRVFSLADVKHLCRVRDLLQRDRLNPAGVRRLLGPAAENGSGDAEALARPTSQVGRHLRRLRRQRGQSLRELASRTGLSASYISSIERSLANPSVAALQKLAAALDSNVLIMLGEEYDADDDQLVVTPGERKTLDLGVPGVVFETLASVKTQLEPLLMRVAPGMGCDEPYAHEGEEFIYVVDGVLEITIEETRTYVLEVGDAMTFASHRPHRWHNPGTVETVLVWVNTPQTF